MAEKTNIEQMRRELKRRSMDIIKLYNPLNEPFETIYDSFRHVIPAKSEDSFPRYIAQKWIKEFIDDQINKEEQKRIDKENESRKSKGWDPISPQEREQFDIRYKLTTDNEELRKQWLKIIYKGVTKEYGATTPERIEKDKKDKRPQDVVLMEQLDTEMGFADMMPETEQDYDIPEIESKKDSLAKEIEDE